MNKLKYDKDNVTNQEKHDKNVLINSNKLILTLLKSLICLVSFLKLLIECPEQVRIVQCYLISTLQIHIVFVIVFQTLHVHHIYKSFKDNYFNNPNNQVL
jgi:hypothetical protein